MVWLYVRINIVISASNPRIQNIRRHYVSIYGKMAVYELIMLFQNFLIGFLKIIRSFFLIIVPEIEIFFQVLNLRAFVDLLGLLCIKKLSDCGFFINDVSTFVYLVMKMRYLRKELSFVRVHHFVVTVY